MISKRWGGGVRLVASLLVAMAALSGCAAQALQERQAQLAPLVGQSEADLVRQLGVPTRTYEAGGAKFLAYEQRRSDLLGGFGGFGPYGGFGWGGGYWRGGYGGAWGGGFPADIVTYSCDTTFELTGGVVRNFALRGNACGFLPATG